MPEALFYNGMRVEFEDPADPRAAALAAGEDVSVDPDAVPEAPAKAAKAKPAAPAADDDDE